MSHRSLFSGLSTLALAGLFALPSAAIVPSDDPAVNYSTIQAAVDAGGTVTLAAGTYPLMREIVISNGASLVGGGTKPEDVVLSLETQTREDADHSAIVITNSANTVVSNLTLTANKAKTKYDDDDWGPKSAIIMNSGTVVNCLFREWVTRNNKYCGAGVNMTGGTVRGCTITKCDAQDSSGAAMWGDAICAEGNDCLIENCVITNNGKADAGIAKNAPGGAVWIKGGVLRGCLIANNVNRGAASGVAVYGGSKASDSLRTVVENCTIVGNRAGNLNDWYEPHGLCVFYNNIWDTTKSYNVTLRNNIIWGNLAYDGKTEANYNFAYADTATLNVVCNNSSPVFPATATTSGCISVDPGFADAAAGNYRVASYTYCVDAGVNQDWMNSAVDLDGNPRIGNGTVDLGCYERLTSSGPECRMSVVSNGTLDNSTVQIDCEYVGGTASVANWTFTRQQDNAIVTQSDFTGAVNLPVGLWDAKVVVSGGGQSAEAEVLGAVYVHASQVYANANGSDEFPYDTAAKGAHSVDTAFDLAGFGGTLYIAEGEYVIEYPLALSSANCANIESLSGPENTVIRLANCDNFTSMQNYGATLSCAAARLAGVTIVAGLPGPHYDGAEYWTHGLVKVAAEGAVVTNCVFRDFQCYREGKGSGNRGKGLDLTAGTVVDSTFTRIYYYTAGGALKEGGVISMHGGLADRLRIVDCWDDSNPLPGSYLNNCYGDIVGVYDTAVLRNSLVTGCTSKHESIVGACISSGKHPGEDQGGTIINCTIVSNSNLGVDADYTDNGKTYYRSRVAGVISDGGNVINCIIADNYSAYANDFYNYGSTTNLKHKISFTLVADTLTSVDFATVENLATPENHNIVQSSSVGVFKKPVKGDYTLMARSPAINAGFYDANDTAWDWMKNGRDLAGRARLISKIPDLGCYEAPNNGFAIRVR